MTGKHVKNSSGLAELFGMIRSAMDENSELQEQEEKLRKVREEAERNNAAIRRQHEHLKQMLENPTLTDDERDELLRIEDRMTKAEAEYRESAAEPNGGESGSPGA